jgi:tetratricopeptide (TPR) repeat protein
VRTADELWALLRESETLPHGVARIALIEQVLRHVEAIGDPNLSFTTRMLATTAYVYGGEPVKSFPTFAWCVADFDRSPGPHHRRWAHNLLWDFKAMVSALTRFPEIPLDRTFAVLDDMERRYREGGHSMQAVHKRRHLVARHLGHSDQEDEWFERWQAAPRDELSDCAGCDPTSVLVHLGNRQRYEEAVELGRPVLAGDLSCNEQPQNILTQLMVPYLLTGRTGEAVDAHRRAYGVHRSRLADLGDIAQHIEFCARTGNEHRGFEILQRHLGWLPTAPAPATAMYFAAAGGLVLRRITELGHGELTVRRAGQPDTTAAELAVELADLATGIAARFDARNGSGHQGRLVAEQLAAEPYEVAVVLSPSAPAHARTSPVRPASAPAAEPQVPAGLDAAALLDRADQHRREGREGALAATLDAVDARFPVLDDPLLAGRRAVLLGDRIRSTDRGRVLDLWAEAEKLFTAAGADGETSTLRGRMALERAYAGEFDEKPLRADTDYQEQHGDPARQADAWARLSILYFLQGRVDEANEAGDRGDACAGRTGDPRMIAVHALVRARNRAAAERHDEALEAARSGYEFFRDHGPARRLAEAGTVYGHTLDDPAEQLEVFGVVLATGIAEHAVPAHLGRGNALKRLDRSAEAITDLVEAVAIFAAEGFEEGGAFARIELAEAYAQAGRPTEAAEVAEEALLVLDRIGDTQAADNARFLLAKQYQQIGDSDGALARYRELIERLDGNPAGRAQIVEEAGGLLFDLDRDAEAAESFAVAATALHEIGDLVGELRALRRRVAALHYADDAERAEETIRLAAARWAELPAELSAEPEAIWHHGMTAYETGRVLMSRGRYAEALPHLRGADGRLRAIGATDDADQLAGMYAEALLRSGSPAEAEPVLRKVLDGMAPDAPGRETTEKVYAEVREALGRSDRDRRWRLGPR